MEHPDELATHARPATSDRFRLTKGFQSTFVFMNLSECDFVHLGPSKFRVVSLPSMWRWTLRSTNTQQRAIPLPLLVPLLYEYYPYISGSNQPVVRKNSTRGRVPYLNNRSIVLLYFRSLSSRSEQRTYAIQRVLSYS